jgi:hypothetical protein
MKMSNDQIMIHVRFSPDGTVREIGARPQTLSAQDWFNRLSTEAASAYQSLSGGRGLFRLSPVQLQSLQTGLS